MPFNIAIAGAKDEPSEVADTIRHVAGLIEEGYTSGINPTWTLSTEHEHDYGGWETRPDSTGPALRERRYCHCGAFQDRIVPEERDR